MKTILCAILSLSIMMVSLQASACALKGTETGSACSVKELQNLEKTKMQETGFVKGEKNLRPVRITPEIKNPEQTQCIFCIQRGLFDKIKP